MSEEWMVISNSGQHAVLVRGLERLNIPKPKDTSAKELFMSIRPGTLIDDGVIAMISPKKQ